LPTADGTRQLVSEGENGAMTVTIGMVGAGEFGREFATLFQLHPRVGAVYVTDHVTERAEKLAADVGLAGTVGSFEQLLESDVDAVAIFTQRWQHGPLVERALLAGKHVYSAVPMGVSASEIAAIVHAVEQTGLVYMMGETSHYNPAAVFARQKLAEGAFGRIFYCEGDYVHDISQFRSFARSGGPNWKSFASFPPMAYPTHAIGGVLSVLPSHVVSVSCIGVRDAGYDDGIYDAELSAFGNDFSNESALFELSDGGVLRTNEMRRVGYPTHIRESRFRFFGTEGSFEQIANASVWQNREDVWDVTEQLATGRAKDPDRTFWQSGYAPIQDTSNLPVEILAGPNGHEGVHPFLAHDFVRAVDDRTLPPINAWQAARYTLPGILAHESANQHGARLAVPDHGDAPLPVHAPMAQIRHGRD
jgi:predicted dehydrogenase